MQPTKLPVEAEFGRLAEREKSFALRTNFKAKIFQNILNNWSSIKIIRYHTTQKKDFIFPSPYVNKRQFVKDQNIPAGSRRWIMYFTLPYISFKIWRFSKKGPSLIEYGFSKTWGRWIFSQRINHAAYRRYIFSQPTQYP